MFLIYPIKIFKRSSFSCAFSFRKLTPIIRDVKENMAEEQPSEAVATAEAVKGIRAALPDKPQSELTADDVSTAITAYIGTMITILMPKT